MRDATLNVSHRLATVLSADRIVVRDGGHIVARAHAELLRQTVSAELARFAVAGGGLHAPAAPLTGVVPSSDRASSPAPPIRCARTIHGSAGYGANATPR